MREWKFWDWVAYAALFLATGVEAFEAGLKQAPKLAIHMPDILTSEWLSFVPFFLVCVATVILVLRMVSVALSIPRQLGRSSSGRSPGSGHVPLYPTGYMSPSPPDCQWLSRAAPTLYGLLGKCTIRDKIDARGKDDDGIVNVVARMIGQFADIYGCRSPSNVIEQIDHSEVDNLEFSTFATLLYDKNNQRPVWSGLHVRNADLERATAAILNSRHSSALQIR